MAFNSLKEKKFCNIEIVRTCLQLLLFLRAKKKYIYITYMYTLSPLSIHLFMGPVVGEDKSWKLSAHWWAELSSGVSGCPVHGGPGVAVDLLVGDAGAQVVPGLCSPHGG